jgi:glutathione synthase/RimK-type ligase-like ATP-grasp enzyme
MEPANTFDVLVVYTESVATSSSSKKTHNTTPFSLAKGREHYAAAYAYFLTKCSQIGLSAAFTTSADIVGPGKCKSYWVFKEDQWEKVNEFGFAPLIFDKVSPLRKGLRKKRDLLFAEGISLPFNDTYLLALFNDKLKTFKKLYDFTIPTVNITQKTVSLSLSRLEGLITNHKNKNDFSDSFVLKDRFGAGGIDIYLIGKNPIEHITKILKASPRVNFVLQPFAKFDKGYGYKQHKGYTDIRVIYSRGKIVQRYIRTAKASDFRCNEHQGGKVMYIGSSAIPRGVTIASNAILGLLKSENALFALDFIVSNNGNVYFLEGNINPGIYWGSSIEDKVNTKKLIKVIVKELKRRTEENIVHAAKTADFGIPAFNPLTPIPKIPLAV